MDFRFTPEQDAFRADVRRFLDETLTPDFWRQQRERDHAESSPEFSRAGAERGWLAIAWPPEYGGQGRGYFEQMIYMEEMAYAGAPQEHHRRAVQQVGPSIILFGTEEQKREYLPKIAAAEISFAMGLSEPNAGSDLANVETRAVRDGDDYLVTGAKRFTSGAHYSDFLWTVVRTDPAAPKHRGISMLVVPLDAPGVTVRPLLDMQDRHHFNEVFLDEVRVPARNIVGDENRGWYVNATTMDFERSGIARIARLRRVLDHCIEALRHGRAAGRATEGAHVAARHRLADLAAAVEVSANLAYRVVSLQSSGKVPNYEVSITKLLASETSQALHNLGVNYAGLNGLLAARGESDEASDWRGGGQWGPGYIAVIPDTIAQGSSEIQRNVIATRGLGLPRG
jgi:alkylation response protein AidB-like acyl-CoA dehydrogenase